MIALKQGIVWGADVVMMQEPVVEKKGFNISHPEYRLVRGGRTMTAMRRDTHLEFSEVDMEGDGDVQEFDIKYPSGKELRLVNVYDQLRQVEGVRSQGRSAQTAKWREIMGRNRILVGGDRNAHSNRWDLDCPPKRDDVFLTNLLDQYKLTEVTDGEATITTERKGEISKSLIDFFITKDRMANNIEIATNLATTSDHAIVCAQLKWDKGDGVKVSRKISGWDIDGLRSEGEEEKENYKKAEKIWKNKSSERPVLDENSGKEDLQKEAEWIQQNFVNHLNRYCKKVKVCARSKRWWNEEIAENRNILGSLKRARRRGVATQ